MTSGWLIALLVAGMLLLIAASKSVWGPIRWLGFGVMQLVIGAVLLFFANLVGELADFHIPINPVTALLTGLLRLPGLAALIVIKMWMI
ncbi:MULTISPECIES: pro-sigmaK processing inhibitor BofA family protein [Brevibacillus]|jgi:inhibitor of the pro-sigma K processing machinery|uniref:Sigma-K factor processing regulatory protein n=1 Tax=Brevibacillus borstelensis AK1 TaxID=1300222 RepID=M8DVK9_9BACL|nr:pro-sigmaK processing inhibitor BofA family protein [Brevibacillus borstelensis]EMT51026.1 sigma-K factor processing regulatory protein [Brevibacillus borstelensis AK1]KKX52747.1 pro-sigma K processing regulatory protein [Brevibacillus borstelensis cifa_chp40]MBE5396636.1 pro-sigmaK processing inhibitor BofA family protein [Brevibacillus borstelensis]MCC0566301.1 pro-sigmaK processing inhibitor BofA family protein [Brevibacillus borstelensis]MCM3472986.1 pro-sigmaK processing inhibitor BofA